MRRALRLAATAATILSFSAQIIGAESLALLAGPSAARQLMPPPASFKPTPVEPAALPAAAPLVAPPAAWGYYVLAAGEIALESAVSARRQARLRWSRLARGAGSQAGGLIREVEEAFSFEDPASADVLAPIDLPSAAGPVVQRIAEPAAPAAELMPAPGKPIEQAQAVRLESALKAEPLPLPTAPPELKEQGTLEIRQEEFADKVLGSATPVLVMFDAARNCHCAEAELLQLRRQWHGDPAVFSLNAQDSPALARKYGVNGHATVLLFKGGGLVKKADAADMERRVMARHGGKYDSADMKAELAAFAKPAHKISVYSTVWCPHCRDAKKYLADRGFAFEVRDIEKDPMADMEYRALHGRGVPLVVIDGTPVTGFVPEAFDRLLKD